MKASRIRRGSTPPWRAGRWRALAVVFVVAVPLLATACATHGRQVRSNALDYLYPAGVTAQPPSDVALTLPARVGVAFAPGTLGLAAGLTEEQKQTLLERIKATFEKREFIASVQPIPSTYLKPGGGFDDLDRVAGVFGIDVAVLISYEQVQFSDSGKASLAYWTIIGAYIVEGEKNETTTMLDAAVFDIKSQAMLFNAPGQSGIRGSSTPIEVDKELRERSAEGFDEAMTNLIANLDAALSAFEEQARSGTVRGAGTPAIAFRDASGQPLVADPNASAGATGVSGAIAASLLALAAWLGCRARRS